MEEKLQQSRFREAWTLDLGPWIWEGLAEAKDLRGWALSMVLFTWFMGATVNVVLKLYSYAHGCI